ncbi:GNAT family N-acetyltransferase [Clostridium sp.]
MHKLEQKELKTNKFQYKFLEWDTDYFGINSGRVTFNDTIGNKEWKIVSKELHGNDFNVIDNVNNNSTNNFYISKLAGAFVTDINFQFTKVISNKAEHVIKYDISVQNKVPVNNGILEISKNSYKHSRFFNDPYLNKQKSKDVYGHWVESSFLNENKYFIICHIDSKVAGYILFSLDYKSSTAIIELISVKESMKSRFIGTEMMIYLENYVYNSHKDIKYIRVGTQSNNINAINFYVGNGFRVKEIRSVYHYWPNKGMGIEVRDEVAADLEDKIQK